MSQYVNFFIRKENSDDFIYIAAYSRSTALYDVMNDVPYEKVRELSYEELQNKIKELYEAKAASEKKILSYKRQIDYVCQMNNPLDDKYELIASIDELIEEFQQDIKNINKQGIELNFIAELKYNNFHIYAGIEAYSPTTQDIIEK